MDLLVELNDKVRLLDKALLQLGNRGREHAQAEHDYRVALSKQILICREAGVPVTIISDLCRGDRDVAELKKNRDVSEVVYKSALEAVNVYKLQIRVIEGQIEREWKG